ncbi:hypothetical protein YTPLAS18_02030 [Nitrospira sp.]|nr:hypothetical protein YTPLAS18_02030 [Nitrospira sp.]
MIFCRYAAILLSILVALGGGMARAADGLDVVTLKDGSVIYGEVLDLDAGKLRVKTGFGDGDGVVTLKWKDVSGLTLAKPGSFTTVEGSIIRAQAVESQAGHVTLKGEPLSVPVDVPLSSIKAINVPSVQFTGNATVGISGASGNSEYKNFSGLFDLVARNERLRLTLMGRYIYGESDSALTARNALATIKLDFFLTKRWYWFTNAYFEQDTFQDLKLRTAIGTGPGYQLIDKGDFNGIFSDMLLSAETGVSYFNEDFRTPTREDMSSVRGRWAIDWVWTVIKDRVSLFHNDQGYVSYENASDFYIIANQGATLNIYKNFIIRPQVTYRYNNNPVAGTQKSDTIYLITFGYSL